MKVESKIRESRGVNHHGEKMKAICIHSYGDTSVMNYEDVPIPVPGADEILIKVHAAGVNPIDAKMRQGYIRTFLMQHKPGILGWDVAGVVEEVGSLVTRFKPGDNVFCDPSAVRNGSYAEYMCVKSFDVCIAPERISLIEAAGVPLASQTAWTALFEKANLKAGQSILIHGAAGGVGTFAVQLAKLAGARVIGTCSKSNAELVKSLGADEVIDYQTEDFSRKLKELDVVIDTIGGETQLKSLYVLKQEGVLVSTVGLSTTDAASKLTIKTITFSLSANGARLGEIAGLIDDGSLKVVIDRTFPLQEAQEAHRLIETHHAKGKIILTVE